MFYFDCRVLHFYYGCVFYFNCRVLHFYYARVFYFNCRVLHFYYYGRVFYFNCVFYGGFAVCSSSLARVANHASYTFRGVHNDYRVLLLLLRAIQWPRALRALEISAMALTAVQWNACSLWGRASRREVYAYSTGGARPSGTAPGALRVQGRRAMCNVATASASLL